MVLWQQIFLHFGAADFPFKFPLKSAEKMVVFLHGRRDPSGFGAAIYESCAACVSFFIWPFRHQDSKTRAAVLLPHALDRWLLVTSQLFAHVEKNAAAQACLNVGPTGNSQQSRRIE